LNFSLKAGNFSESERWGKIASDSTEMPRQLLRKVAEKCYQPILITLRREPLIKAPSKAGKEFRSG
jgi:hypothetical protein